MAGVVEEIKSRLDIVEVISPHVPLKKAGRNFKGLCPFHSEKTPSFVVFPDQGSYHCFGCGQGGDIFTFLMKTQNLTFPEALQQLAGRAGVELVSRPEAAAEDRERERLREITAAAAHYFHNLLLRAKEAQVARDYLQARGLTPTTIEAWQLGYALDRWDALIDYLVERGYAVEDLLAAGLVRQRDDGSGYYDYFRHRIIFPIRDVKSHVTGFGARILGEGEPKYLNSPQTLLFDKSATLYGLDRARDAIRQRDQVILVEGYFDVLMTHQMGISNVVAPLGTALNEKHINLLKRLTKNIVLALDPDRAGQEATLRGLDVAKAALDKKAVPVPTWRGLIHFDYKLDADIRILSLPAGQDPDEVARADPDGFTRLIAAAQPVVDYYFQVITSRHNLADPKGKSALVRELLPVIREIGDPVQQSHYLQRLGQLVQVEETLLRSEMYRQAIVAPMPKGAAPSPGTTGLIARMTDTEVEDLLLALILAFPFVVARTEGIKDEDFRSTTSRELFHAWLNLLTENPEADAGYLRETLPQPLAQHLDYVLQRYPAALVTSDAALAQAQERIELLGEVVGRPVLLTEASLIEAIDRCSLRLRHAACRRELSQIQPLLDEATATGDDDSLARLGQRITQIQGELRLLNQAWDQMGRLMSHRPA